MSYSNFAMHCRSNSCDAINEPVNKNRKQTNGNVVADYRCDDCGYTFRQEFQVNHEAQPIEPPEVNEDEELPPPPPGDVMEWTEEERDNFIEAYGIEKYKSLIVKHTKEGHAEYKRPEDEPDMPTDHDPRKWSNQQKENFIEEHGRDAYQDKVAALYAPPEED